MSTQSGPLALAELSAVASSLPLPCPITMTITDKNIYYVGSPLPVPPNISRGSGSSLSPSKASFSWKKKYKNQKSQHPLLALMLPFIAPMKGEPEHEGVSSPVLLFFSQLFLPNFNFHLFPCLFQKRGRRRRRLEGGGGANESGTLPCDNCHAEWTSPLFIGF